jgi:predicted nucleic acid-binding Zn ribbon protein
MSRDPEPPTECAQCGADIPPRARACPGCGADERTGWREQSVYDGLNLPDDETDDDTRSAPRSSRPRDRLAWYWVLTIIAVLLLLIVSALGLR